MSTVSAAVFYPAFPHYRRRILEKLLSTRGLKLALMSGDVERGEIARLGPRDITPLQEFRTVPFLGIGTVQRGAFSALISKNFDCVILAPALSSLTVWGTVLVRRILGRTTMLWGQCGKPGERGAKRLLKEALNRCAHKLLVYGESEYRAAIELGTDPAKVEIIGNSTFSFDDDVEPSSEAGFRHHSDSHVRLLYSGRIIPRKRVDVLLTATKLLIENGVSAEAVIVGDGESLESLRNMAASQGIPAEFYGAIYSSNELSAIFQSCTLVVAPAEIGLLAVDALLNNVPVLYPTGMQMNGPEFEALTLGINAWHIDPFDERSIAKGVLDYLARRPALDPSVIREARSSALKNWSAESVASKIVAAIKGRHQKALLSKNADHRLPERPRE